MYITNIGFYNTSKDVVHEQNKNVKCVKICLKNIKIVL
jgi:hypothetical protein